MTENSQRRYAFQPKISVCMATYNGERHIEEQLRSILIQLRSTDEVVIVDDASTDLTRTIIQEVNDTRVQMHVNTCNRGVLASFETSLLKSSGDIIFFSDQDDVWESGKLSTILQLFEMYPDVTVIASDATVIDDFGKILNESYYSTRSPFKTGLFANLFHFRFQGCGMAFRRSLFGEIFPFPHGFDLLHDEWIGLRARISGHKIYYLNTPLFQYRRHLSNTSHTLPRGRQIKVRLHLVTALFTDAMRRRMNRSIRRVDRDAQA
jgi:glycosyltransferase involved in cell wall biosynthesis